MALGHAGLGNMEKCQAFLSEIRSRNPNHQGAAALESLIEKSLLQS